jgi:TonB-linked SusC/RagA family outer membrane protein
MKNTFTFWSNLRLAIFFVFLLPFSAFAQEPPADTVKVKVAITVKSAKDSSLLPASAVLVKGKSQTSVTDENGFTSMVILQSDSVLLVTREGFVAEEINIVAIPELAATVFLKLEVESRSRGYSLSSPLASFPGSQASISGNLFQAGNYSSFENGFQGQVAGLHTISSSGNLNSYTSVLIRGLGTSVLGTEPLYIIDGVPVTSGSNGDGGGGIGLNYGYNTSPLAEINPSDIQSIQVLKGGPSTVLYGGRGANGVIEIFTKRGVPGRTKLNVGYQFGLTNPTNRVEMLTGSQYMNALDQGFSRSYYYDPSRTGSALPGRSTYIGRNANPYITNEVASTTNVDPLDQMLRNGAFQQLDLSASGGNKLVRFLFGGTYNTNKGIQQNNDFNRLSIKFNTDVVLSDQIKFGSSMYFSLSQSMLQPSGLNSYGGGFGEAQSTALPIFPERFDARNNNLNPYVSFNPFFDAYSGNNIGLLTNQNHFKLEKQVFRSIGDVFGEIKFKKIPGLRVRLDFGFDYHSNFDRTFQSSLTRKGQDVNISGDTVLVPSSKAGDFRSVYFNLSYSGLAEYTKSFGPHNLRFFSGLQYQQITNEFNGITSERFPSGYSKLVSFGSRFSDRPIGAATGFATANYFGGADYNLRGKYFAGVASSFTAFSRYGSDVAFLPFPAATLGWDIKKEGWLDGISFLSGLYLHAGSGLSGNSLLTNVQARGYWRGTLPYVDLGTFPGRYPFTLSNRNLEPERNWVNEVEIRTRFLEDRLFANVGYFHRQTLNMILNFPTPPSMGLDGVFFPANGGTIINQGFEFALGGEVLKKNDFSWTISANMATLKNEVTSTDILRDDQTNHYQGVSTINGGGAAHFFLPKWGGFAPSDHPEGKWKKGDELIFDRSGQLFKPERLSQIDSAAVALNQSVLPKFYGGINNVLKYKQFTLDFLFTFSFGNHILDEGERIQSYLTGNNNIRGSANDGNLYYLGGSDSTLLYSNLLSQRSTSRFVHDASYVRLKNLGLTYAFPKGKGFFKKVQAAQVFFRMQNVLTFTSFKGWDPEAATNMMLNGQRALGIGSTRFDLPQFRTFLVGFNITL